MEDTKRIKKINVSSIVEIEVLFYVEHVIYVNWLLILTLNHIELYHKYSLLNEFVISFFKTDVNPKNGQMKCIILLLFFQSRAIASRACLTFPTKEIKMWHRIINNANRGPRF